MSIDIRISLSIPDEKKTHRHFSLRLQQGISIAPVKYTMPGKILAVSGFEGNFMALLKTLIANKVIDKYLRWTFKDGHLVIPGNCFDKDGQVVECLWLLYALEEKARKAGGYVHFLAGTHEIVHINSPWRYIHPQYAQSSGVPHTALYHGNNELWLWLRTKNLIVQIGDLLFIHEGIPHKLLTLSTSIVALNGQLRHHWLNPTFSGANPLAENVLSGNYCYQPSVAGTEELAIAVLKKFGVRKIITSNPSMNEIISLFDGKVINIHTIHGTDSSEALLIKKNRYYVTQNYRKRERIK